MAKIIENLMSGIYHNGEALSFGYVYFYEAGTSTKKNVYKDRSASIISPNPLQLDVDGRAKVFAEGIYKIVITDKNKKQIASFDEVEYTNASSPVITDLQRTGNQNVFDNSSFERWTGGLPDMTAHINFGAKIITSTPLASNVAMEQDTDGSIKITPSVAPWYIGVRFDNLTAAMEALEQWFIFAAKVKASDSAVYAKVFDGASWNTVLHSGGGEYEELTPEAIQYEYVAETDYIDLIIGSDTDTSVVNVSQMWGNVGKILRPPEPTAIDFLADSSLSGFADPNGDETNKFKVADATADNEAVNKGQMDTADEGLQSQITTNADDISTNADNISNNATNIGNHNHSGTYEPVITKLSGFNKAKSDDPSENDTNKLATTVATKAVKDLFDALKTYINNFTDFTNALHATCISMDIGGYTPQSMQIMPLATEVKDLFNAFASNRFTAPRTNTWRIHGKVQYPNGAYMGDKIEIRKNGSVVKTVNTPSSSSYYFDENIALTSGDYIELWVAADDYGAIYFQENLTYLKADEIFS